MRASRYHRRLLLAGAGGIALLAVTALGAGGSDVRSGSGGGGGRAALLLGAIAAVAVLIALMTRRPLSKLARVLVHVLALSVPIVVLGLLAAAAMREQRRISGEGLRPLPRQAVGARTATPPPLQTSTAVASTPSGGSGGTTPVWVALGVLVLVSGAAVVAVRRGRPRKPPRERRPKGPPAEEPLPELGDPAAIADPRAAIIAAFARMEAELRLAELPRRRGEGPIEFTERIAATRPAFAQPVRRLARAYAPAKFSEHPIDAQMRRDALVALDALQQARAAERAATAAAMPPETAT